MEKRKKSGMTPEKALEVYPENKSNLKMLRVKKGLSQNDLSVASNVNIRNIQTYENGQRNIDGAGLEILCDLCRVLDCTIADILESEELKEKYKKVK